MIHPSAIQTHFGLIKNLVEGNLSVLSVESPQPAPLSFVRYYNSNAQRQTGTSKELAEGTVAVVELIGAMTKYGGMCSYGTMEIAGYMQHLMGDERIDGIVLLIDGPGGAVSGIPPLLELIEKRSKPIVALCDLAASAHYYLASQCDYILAENSISSSFGSIGVMIGFADVQPMLEKKGVRFHQVYADYSGHKNESFKLMLEGKYDQIKSEALNPMALEFQKAVRKGRGDKLKEEVEGVLTGRMFRAEKALEVGLIDGVGSLKEAIEKVHQLSAATRLKQALESSN
jgi:protease-4